MTSDARFCEFCGTLIAQPVPPIPKPVSAFPAPSDRTKTLGKVSLKLLAVMIIVLIVGFGIGASSFRTSPEAGYMTITETNVLATTVTKTLMVTSSYIAPARQEENSRLNPVPMGQKVTRQTIEGGYPVEFWVIGVERNAYAKIEKMNMFNSKPDAGEEAILVMMGVKFGGPPTERFTISSWEFSLVGEKGIVHSCRWDVLKPDLTQEVFGGATIEGYISFNVAQGEQDLVLIVGSDNPSYMALS